MKKFSLILALLAALSFVFIGCPDGGGGGKKQTEELEHVIVFDMSDADNGTVAHGIQALVAGTTLAFPDDTNPIVPLVRAGGDAHTTVKAIDAGGGKIGIEFDTKDSWGVGIDLPDAAFGFREGDEITVTGKVVTLASGGRIQFNRQIGGEMAIGNVVSAQGNFTLAVTLSVSDVSAIRGNSNKALRLEARATGNLVEIYNILIEGDRPSTIVQLAAPVVSVTENGVSWTAIDGASGYEVYADGELVRAVAENVLSINLNSISALAPGQYSITVVALGVVGSTSASNPSTAVSYTKPEPGQVSAVLVLDDPDAEGIYGWKASDPPNGIGFKGKFNSAISAEIMSYTGEVWLYWEYTGTAEEGIGANYGIGTFGDVSYNAGVGGLSGIAKILIEELQLDNGELNLNPYNNCSIVKIEVYAEGAAGGMYELGEFTSTSGVNQGIWGFNGVDGDLDWGAFVAAKYLIIETKNSDNRDGFGGLQVILQGDGNTYDWAQTNVIDGWKSFANTATDTVYIVVQLDTLVQYGAVVGGTKGKIIIAMYPLANLGFQTGYLAGELETPADAVDLEVEGSVFGYITKGE